MDYKEISEAVKLCGSTPKIDQCRECRYWNGGDMSLCIPKMTEECSTAITELLATVEQEKQHRLHAEEHADKFMKECQELDGKLKSAECELNGLRIFYNDVSSMTNCNTCKNELCEYRPKAGQSTRFNCPLWKGEEEKSIGKHADWIMKRFQMEK